jgi:GAF domain-containing protein
MRRRRLGVIGDSNVMHDRRDRQQIYVELIGRIDSILTEETDPILWMSTLACLIKETFGFIWVGFYLKEGDGLSIGPYQGSLGCLHIPAGRGVCGACVSRLETIVVSDVHKFPGHISCDQNSNSEIVVPIFDEQNVLRAVLDIDSSELGEFQDLDQEFLEKITHKMRSLVWSRIT